MTEGRCTALLFSFLLHGIILAALLITPLFDTGKDIPMILSLSFIKPAGTGQAGAGGRPKSQERLVNKEIASQAGARDSVRNSESISRQEIVRKNETTPGDTGSIGPKGHSGDSAAHGGTSSASTGTGSGDVKKLNYSGPGGADERHYSFIRDTIMQGIAYPERARRMGWQGRVLLSFTVRENGSIDDVKVVTSSGFPVLDENARETIVRTNFRKKVPVRLYVLLPVEYKLR